MSLLTSILNLTVVVAAGWFTIYYIIPKIESGELGLGLPGSGTKKDEEQQIPEDIAGAATAGDEPEPPPPEDEEPAPKEEKSTKKQKKGKGEWLSGDKTGKDNRKKKPEAKKEFRIIEYLAEMGY